LVFAADKPNEVSLKLYRGYAIVVRGSVGNLKNLNFLIDTGANLAFWTNASRKSFI